MNYVAEIFTKRLFYGLIYTLNKGVIYMITCIALFILVAIVSLIIYKLSKNNFGMVKGYFIAFVAILIFSLGTEATLFNINHYSTKNYSQESLYEDIVEYKTADNTHTFYNDEQILFIDVNSTIENVHIDLSENCSETATVRVYLTDEANEYFYDAGTRTLYRDVESSQYITVHNAGESRNLALIFSGDDGYVKVDDISINAPRSFHFNLTRAMIFAAILILLYVFKPSSPIYKHKLLESHNLRNNFAVGFITVQCIIFIIVGTINPTFLGLTTENGQTALAPLAFEHHNQYDELAQAILQGKTYIDNDDVPQSLIDMENPYDRTARSYKSMETGDTYRWDVAYYDGHYYVYFGIVPLLLMYLPCRALLNAPFPSAIGIIIFASVFALGVFKLLALLCRKYFKNVSVGTYLLTALSFVNCCGAMFLVKRPDFYSVPIITAMAFVTWGIYLWLKGRDAEKKKNLYFLGGSLCCALAVGCRPQSVLMCAVALPIFLGYFFKEKKIKEKSGILNLIVLGIPFIIVAAGIMYYNYIRFDSPFDFGSSYNLTTNDVTRRGFELGRTGLGLFTYLFQPPSFDATFPYIRAVSVESNYVGKTIKEACFGGIITVTPVLWSLFLLPKVKSLLKEKKLYGFTALLILIGIATVIANTQAGGLLQRYFSDFGYIFFIAAAIIIFALSEKFNSDESRKNFHTILLLAAISSIVYTFALVFSVSDVTIDTQNPSLFGFISHSVEFWK